MDYVKIEAKINHKSIATYVKKIASQIKLGENINLDQVNSGLSILNLGVSLEDNELIRTGINLTKSAIQK